MKRSQYTVERDEKAFKRRRVSLLVPVEQAKQLIMTGRYSFATPEMLKARRDLWEALGKEHFSGEQPAPTAVENKTHVSEQEILQCLRTRRTTCRQLEMFLRALALKSSLHTECPICFEPVFEIDRAKLRVMSCGAPLCSDCITETCYSCRQPSCQPQK